MQPAVREHPPLRRPDRMLDMTHVAPQYYLYRTSAKPAEQPTKGFSFQFSGPEGTRPAAADPATADLRLRRGEVRGSDFRFSNNGKSRRYPTGLRCTKN